MEIFKTVIDNSQNNTKNHVTGIHQTTFVQDRSAETTTLVKEIKGEKWNPACYLHGPEDCFEKEEIDGLILSDFQT